MRLHECTLIGVSVSVFCQFFHAFLCVCVRLACMCIFVSVFHNFAFTAGPTNHKTIQKIVFETHVIIVFSHGRCSFEAHVFNCFQLEINKYNSSIHFTQLFVFMN